MAASPLIGARDTKTQDSRPGLFRSLSKRLTRQSSSSKAKKIHDDPGGRSSHPVGGRILTLRALPALPRDDNDDDDDDDIHDLVLRHTGTRVAYEDARRRVVPNSSRRGSANSEFCRDNIAGPDHWRDRDTRWSLQGTMSTKQVLKPRLSSTLRPLSTLEDSISESRPRRRWSRSEPSSVTSTAATTTCPLAEPLTLRDVLMKRILASQTRPRHKQQSPPSSNKIKSNSSGTPPERPLTPVQTRELISAMEAASKLALDVRVTRLPALCAVCSEPRYTPYPEQDQRCEKGNIREGPASMYMSVIASKCPSLDSDSDSNNNNFLDDFSSKLGRMACCRQHVCSSCLAHTIVQGIELGWSRDILRRGPGWISCPVESCDAVVSLYRCNIRDVLQALGVPDVEQVVRQFIVAAELRSALRGMTPPPTEREIRRGMKFHRELMRLGCAFPALDMDARDVGEVDVKRVTVDFTRKTGVAGTERLKVPLFTHLLNLPRMTKECCICAETYHDIESPNVQSVTNGTIDERTKGQGSWKKAIRNFPGDWAWQISNFPSQDLLQNCAQAHPDVHVCRQCFSKHIDTQLELHGHVIAPSPNTEQERGIPCPVGECQGRKLTHLEVSKLARPETFARYDRLCTLNSISTDPGFRWCLRRGCESGAIYESLDASKPLPALPTNMTKPNENIKAGTIREDSTAARSMPVLPPQPPPRQSSRTFSLATRPRITTPSTTTTSEPQTAHKTPAITHITCHACSFEMCFTCQTPWHANMTCAESLTLLHSCPTDPSALMNHYQTQAWLSQHTKRCPNPSCSAPIEKGDGCFHMTCSACKFQFCWECLADWRGVVVDGRFVRQGHAEGCYFRGENAVPPTQIMGVSVERGLRRTRGLFR